MSFCPNQHDNLPGVSWCSTCGAPMPDAPPPPGVAAPAPPVVPTVVAPTVLAPVSVTPDPVAPAPEPVAAAPQPAASAPVQPAPGHGHARPSGPETSRRGLAVLAGVIGLGVLVAWLVADLVVRGTDGDGYYGALQWTDAAIDVVGESGVQHPWIPVLFAVILVCTYVELLMGSLAVLTGWRRGWTTLLLAAVLPAITWFVVWPVIMLTVVDDGLGLSYGDTIEGVLDDGLLVWFQLPTCALLVVAALLARAGRPSRR